MIINNGTMDKKHSVHMVTITRQGQVTIPRSLRTRFRIKGSTKAMIADERGRIVITPKISFSSLAGSLKSTTKLTDQQIKKARAAFAKEFCRKV